MHFCESAKLRTKRAIRAKTCYVPTCLRAKFPYVPTCHDMLRANVPTCQIFLRTNVSSHVTCQRAYVPRCQIFLRANVPSHVTCQRANVPNLFTCQRAIACCVPTCMVPACHVPIYLRAFPFVVPSIRRQFLKFMGHPAINRFFLMLIFLRLPRVQLSNLKITSKLLGKILKHDSDIIHIENTVETFTITVQCQNIFDWPRKKFPNTKVSFLPFLIMGGQNFS